MYIMYCLLVMMKRELTLSQIVAIVAIVLLIVFVANHKQRGQRYRVISERNDTLECYDTQSSWQGLAVIRNGKVVRIATEHK